MENKIYPCLWFDGKAKEAAEFYSSVFSNSVITSENSFVVTLEISGQKFMLLNGGPQFSTNPSISFFVVCETEKEIDRYWKSLLEGGSELMPLDKYDWSQKYGWLKDRFGISWQIIPAILEKLMNDPKKAPKVVDAFLQMKKFDIEKLVQAYEG